jgi:uncharacterized protein
MAELVLHAKDIDADGKAYDLPLSTEWMASALARTDLGSGGAGHAHLFAQRSGADILVTGHVEARVLASCVRCLEEAPIDVRADLGSLFTARGDAHRPEADEEDLSPEELSREFYTGDVIELDDVVREHILLEVPMQPLCREDCPGIEVPAHVRPPADFGKEPDPRLASLGALAEKLSSGKKE